LPETELRELAKVLSDFTRTPERCWYCVWAGYGGIEETEAGAEIHLRAAITSSPAARSTR